jgi:hypothetical protein
MIKHSLFADQQREAKLNELGDTLRVLEQHVDFARWPLRSMMRRHAPAENAAVVHRFQPN